MIFKSFFSKLLNLLSMVSFCSSKLETCTLRSFNNGLFDFVRRKRHKVWKYREWWVKRFSSFQIIQAIKNFGAIHKSVRVTTARVNRFQTFAVCAWSVGTCATHVDRSHRNAMPSNRLPRAFEWTIIAIRACGARARIYVYTNYAYDFESPTPDELSIVQNGKNTKQIHRNPIEISFISFNSSSRLRRVVVRGFESTYKKKNVLLYIPYYLLV